MQKQLLTNPRLRAHWPARRGFAARLLFVILSSMAMVFFSEKTYWYPQGFAIAELILFYAFPVYACFWTIEHFRVRRLPALILVAALYAFLVEGVITPVIYEAGLFDPIMPAYFIGTHGLLSVIFGWYFIRKWLVHGQWRRLLFTSALFGLYWGLWSITFWLPENFEGFPRPGQWPVSDFALHALTFTLMLAAAHWLLGRGGWQEQFPIGRIEKWFLIATLIFFFATLAFPGAPLGILKLAVLLALVFLPLRLNRPRETGTTVFSDLTGTIRLRHLWGLMAMPVVAVAVYALAASLQPAPDAIRLIMELTPIVQFTAGGALFLWALVATIRPWISGPKTIRQV